MRTTDRKTAQKGGGVNSDWNREKSSLSPVTSQDKESKSDSEAQPKQHIVATVHGSHNTQLFNMLIPVNLQAKSGDQILTYALLDSGSDSTYITDSAIKRLNLKPCAVPENVTVALAGEETGYRNKFEFSIQGISPSALKVNYQITALEQHSQIPYNKDHVPTDKVTSSIPHLQHIAYLISPKLNASRSPDR